MKFTDISLHPDLHRGISDAEFTDCTPVQEQTIQHVLSDKDVIVQSQTGTGKTAAFLVPIFQLALQSGDAESQKGKPKALIVAPTRELAVQIKEEADMLGKYLPFRSDAFYGGVGYKGQEDSLVQGVDFVIGTPGRLLDFERSGKIDFSKIDYLIVDEADRLFDMGFYPDLQSILRKMKSRYDRRTLLFSATMSTRVMNIAWEHMNEPVEVKIEPEHITVEAIEQALYHVSRDEKVSVLLGLFKKYNPANAIVFTNTKRQAEELAKRLTINGYKTEYIMGDLPQSKRLKVIGSLKRGELQFLVATDVAARGLHVDDLELVVNYDLPEDSESYVHRIGRTARAGKSGRALSLADERFVYGLPAIEQLIGFKIPVGELTEDLFAQDKSAGQRIHLEHSGRDFDGGRRPERSGRGGSRSGSRDGRAPDRSRGPRKPGPAARPVHQASTRTVASQPRKPKEAGRQSSPHSSPRKKMSQEERIAYYRQKYGENFDMDKALGNRGKQGAKSNQAAARKSKPAAARGQARNKPMPQRRNLDAKPEDAGRAGKSPEKKSKKGLLGFLSRLFETK